MLLPLVLLISSCCSPKCCWCPTDDPVPITTNYCSNHHQLLLQPPKDDRFLVPLVLTTNLPLVLHSHPLVHFVHFSPLARAVGRSWWTLPHPSSSCWIVQRFLLPRWWRLVTHKMKHASTASTHLVTMAAWATVRYHRMCCCSLEDDACPTCPIIGSSASLVCDDSCTNACASAGTVCNSQCSSVCCSHRRRDPPCCYSK